MCFLKFGRKLPIMTSLAWCMKFSLLNIAAAIKSLLLSQLFLMSFRRVRKDLGFKEKHQSGYHSTFPPQLINSISCIPLKDLTNFGFGINHGSETKLIIKGKMNTQALQIVCCLQMPNQTNWLSACIDGNPPNTACWVTRQNLKVLWSQVPQP
jgi:hypothetical protein